MLERAERTALLLIRALAVLALALAALGTVLLTLGYDEVWLLESAFQLTHTVPDELLTEPVLTSGGPYALAQALVLGLTGASVLPARLVSLVCLFAAVYLVFRRVRASSGSEGGWIAVSVLLATPGALFYSATAFAEMPAFLLALVASLAAARSSGSRLPWWLGVGVLTGLAAATRLNGVLLLPSLLVLAWPPKGAGARSLREVGLAAVLGAVVFAACLWVQAQFGTAFAAEDAQASAGLSSLLPPYPTVLNAFLLGSHLAPLPLLVAATGGALWASQREASRGAGATPWLLLIPFAWLAYAAWVLKAPIPHLRYLWPALPCFFVLGGHSLASVYLFAKERGHAGARLGVLALVLSLVGSGVVSSVREVVYGDHDAISFEWSGQAPVAEFSRFRALSHQRAAARHLANSAKPDETTLALGMGRAIGYLAQRPVVSTGEALFRPGAWPPPRTSRVFVALLGIQFLHGPAYRWLEENAVVEAKFGPYVFFSVKGPYPENLAILVPDDVPYPAPVVVRPPSAAELYMRRVEREAAERTGGSSR